jgi:hypothetical protein
MSTWKTRARDDDAPLSSPRTRHARVLLPRPRSLLFMLLTALAASLLTYAMSRTPRTTRSCETAASPGMSLVAADVVHGLEDAARTRSVVELTRTVTVKAPAQTIVVEVEVEVEKLVNVSAAPERSLKGPPTPFFRGKCGLSLCPGLVLITRVLVDNLLPDRKYITTFHDAGWSTSICCPVHVLPS